MLRSFSSCANVLSRLSAQVDVLRPYEAMKSQVTYDISWTLVGNGNTCQQDVANREIGVRFPWIKYPRNSVQGNRKNRL